ncbi:alcohol dehydrogenase catalytic domain-containing protein [Flavisphingomonas formosensis]|uniref:alcohol dehydrogenase catalytic domain-containing protein n=1 Tax=Flavisphingomonas formosensis TaxID=861534 RepID=UPI0018DF252C|nr:alcohol dehydrogenase catalytic domain-containing protein [Sphingomonas formosensis]
MRGIIWDGERLHVTDALEVRAPGPGEVQVRVLASGVCHSDLSVMDHALRPAPIVLGHEAAGVVETLGEGVAGVRVGDPVMVTTQTPCGHCHDCRKGHYATCPEGFGDPEAQPFTWQGRPVWHWANCSSFAGLITVRAQQIFDTAGIDPVHACVLGCAVTTGHGSVNHLAEVVPGDVVVVLGMGGIGVNAVQAARLAGAARVVAVDVNPEKEASARHFGADAFVIPAADGEEAIACIRAAAEAPIDAVIECSGAASAIDVAGRLAKPGGTTVLIGLPRPGTTLNLDVNRFAWGGRIVSMFNGGNDPARDLPRLIDLARSGRIDLPAQVTQVWPLGEVEDAIAALRAGRVTRAVLDHRL